MRILDRHWLLLIIPLSILLLILYLVNQPPQSDRRMSTCEIPIVSESSAFVFSQPEVKMINPKHAQSNSGFFLGLLDTNNWPARWHCGIWTPFHGWLYIASDVLIWLAYFMIPLILGFYLYRKKESVPFKAVFVLFIAFILACGLTHLIDAASFWWPAYRLSAVVRFITAVVSMGTVFALVKVTPKVMQYKSPEELQGLVNTLTAVNSRLQEEIHQRHQAEAELKHLNQELEQKVNERTQDLMASNTSLKRTNELFESVQEAAKIGVWEINIEDGKIFCSEEICRIHELPPGTTFDPSKAIDYIHPEYREMIDVCIQKAIVAGEKYDKQIKLITSKNNIIWVRVVGLPLVSNGKTIALRGFLMDINEVKTTRQKIEANRRVLSLALEAGEIGVWNWDIKEGILEWDDSMHKLTGHPKKRFEGKIENFMEIVHPDDLTRVNHTIRTSVAMGAKYDNTYRVVTRKGHIRILHAKGEVSYDERGEATSMVGICINVTAQKKYEENLRESEQRFRATVDYSPIGVALVDLKGRIFTVNHALRNMLGYGEKELLNSGFQKFTHPDDLDVDNQQVKDLLQGKIHTYQVDKRYICKDERIIWIQFSVSLVKDSHKTPKYFIAQVLDITERKMAESNIREIVRQRTAQLEATNQELEAFSYSVSHDLRSPLRSIHGFSQALLEDYSDKLDDIGFDYLNRVSKASVKMGRLIDDLLTLAKITRQEMNVKKVDLSAIAEKIAENLKDSSYPNSEFEIEPKLEGAGDQGLLTVVLENLMGNAAKYSRGSSHPGIEVGQFTDDGKQIFYIKDNGVGFDMAYADKLFGAFQRLHGDKEFEGTGIGLATVKRIIHRHGGDIWAESAVDKGATFYFTLN